MNSVEPVIEKSLIKTCVKCGAMIGPHDPYYQDSEHLRVPKAKVNYFYTCEKCGDAERLANKK